MHGSGPPTDLTPAHRRRVEVVERTTVYNGHFSVERLTLTHERFDGTMTGPLVREVFVSGDSVTVLPFDPVRGLVALIEQIRMAPLLRGADPWIRETVAGRVEPGETLEAVARREAVEETGIALGRLAAAGCTYLSPGDATQRAWIFCGEADLAQAAGVHGAANEHEDIRLQVLPLADALALLDAGGIGAASTAIALHWLARHHGRLEQEWRVPG